MLASSLTCLLSTAYKKSLIEKLLDSKILVTAILESTSTKWVLGWVAHFFNQVGTRLGCTFLPSAGATEYTLSALCSRSSLCRPLS